MSVNPQLESLWQGVASAVREQDKDPSLMGPSEIPPRILDLNMVEEGEYPIYVSGPPDSTITATSMGGGVSTQAYLMRMVTG